MTAPATCSFTLLFLNPITCCHSWHHLPPTSHPLPHHCTTTSLLLLCQKQNNSHSKTFSSYSNPHMPLLHPLSQKPQQHCCVGNPLRKQYAHTRTAPTTILTPISSPAEEVARRQCYGQALDLLNSWQISSPLVKTLSSLFSGRSSQFVQ